MQYEFFLRNSHDPKSCCNMDFDGDMTKQLHFDNIFQNNSILVICIYKLP